MMRKLVNWALAAMLWAVQAQALTPVITPDELLDLLDDPSVVVLDIRNRASWGFDSGHIPGAVSSPYADWRSIPRTADGSLDDAAVSDLVQRAGLTADSKVVIVHTGLNRRSLSSAA